MKKFAVLIVALMMTFVGVSQNHWQPNIHQFPTNMSVISVLDINGIEQQSPYLELGVFCGNECRGSQILSYFDAPVDRYMLFLTVYGENGDPFTFRLYDHFTGQELPLVSSNEMQYLTNDIIGEVFDPYVFSFTGGNCEVTVEVEPAEAGEVTGGGVMPCGTYCTLSATSVEGGVFLGWVYNGETLSTSHEYSFNAVTDVNLVASFQGPYVPVTYEIEVEVKPASGGEVLGAGVYEEGEICTLTVLPSENYIFERWMENGLLVSIEPTYTFEVTGDRHLVAHLMHVTEVSEEVDNLMVYPNPTTGIVHINTEANVGPTRVYDLTGRLVLETYDPSFDLSSFESGVYVVRTADGRAHRIVLF